MNEERMNIISQKCNFYVYKVNNHSQLKPKILLDISSMGVHSLIEDGQKISNSDWHLPRSYSRPYIQHIQELINRHLNKLMQISGIPSNNKLTLKNYWFQQYAEGDYHDWHIHGDCVYSSVYYVDLPQGAARTTFKYAEETFTVDVEEGCILTFPSCFSHCSQPNKASTKTIISFNY
jgi:hypothetical protein